MSLNNLEDGSFVKELAKVIMPESQVYDIYRQKALVIGDTHTLFDDPKMPPPVTLNVSTLDAVVEMIKSGIPSTDAINGKVVIHIAGPDEVHIISPVTGEQRQQFVYMTSKALLLPLPVSKDAAQLRYLPLEQFIPMVHAGFEPSDSKTELLRFVGNTTAGLTKTQTDDGVSQTVDGKKAFNRDANSPVPVSLALVPFRTFPELDQPIIPYMLRMDSVQPKPDEIKALATLLEIDGGKWRIECIAAIRDYLRGQLPDAIILA